MTSVTESALRKRALRHGYRLTRSRQAESADNFGDFMLVDAVTNAVVLGSRFDATWVEISDFLKHEQGGVR